MPSKSIKSLLLLLYYYTTTAPVYSLIVAVCTIGSGVLNIYIIIIHLS